MSNVPRCLPTVYDTASTAESVCKPVVLDCITWARAAGESVPRVGKGDRAGGDGWKQELEFVQTTFVQKFAEFPNDGLKCRPIPLPPWRVAYACGISVSCDLKDAPATRCWLPTRSVYGEFGGILHPHSPTRQGVLHDN